jgi:zinc protease
MRTRRTVSVSQTPRARRGGLLVLALFLVTTRVASGQVVPPPGVQAPPPTKGVVLKGKAPVSEKILDVRLPRPKEGDLPNGIHLMVLEDRRAPQISFTLLIPGAGGYFDAPSSLGIASATAAMMREGTESRSSSQISEQLETLSATLFVGTGMNSLDVSVNGGALAEHADKLFELAADVVLHPSFPEDELTRYKTRTRASLSQNRSFPGFLVQELYQKAIYGDDPAGRFFMTSEQLDKVNRSAMLEFHRARYVPDHAVIAIAGDITYDRARKLVEERFGKWEKRGIPQAMAKEPAPSGPPKVWLIDRPNSVQTNFAVGTQAIERTDPDYDALQVMNAIVGGGPTGRLFLHLREEKGYTYGAYSGLSAGRFRGDWSANTDVRTEVTEPALRDLLGELTAIRDTIVPAKELQDRKRSLIAGFALSLESPAQMLNYYVTRWTYKLPADYWDRYPQRVMGVTAAQVQSVARKYLDPSRLQIVAVGDGKRVESILSKFGPVDKYDVEGKRIITTVP